VVGADNADYYYFGRLKEKRQTDILRATRRRRKYY
jgi:hypothetical protein